MSRFLPELRRLVGANRVTLRPSAAALLTGPIRSNILSKSAAEYDELVARIAQYNSLKEATKDFRYAKYQPGYEDHVAAPNFADYRARIVDQELVNRVEKFYLDAKKRRTSSQPSLPEGWGDLVTALGTPVRTLTAVTCAVSRALHMDFYLYLELFISDRLVLHHVLCARCLSTHPRARSRPS